MDNEMDNNYADADWEEARFHHTIAGFEQLIKEYSWAYIQQYMNKDILTDMYNFFTKEPPKPVCKLLKC